MKNLVNHIIKNGGATYNLMGGQFITSGYMCAKAENEMIISEELTCNHILGYMARYAADLQKNNANLGAWYNSEDGKTYLDTSYRFETLEEAIAFGKANNQLAIFDLNTFTEIRLQEEPNQSIGGAKQAPFIMQKIKKKCPKSVYFWA